MTEFDPKSEYDQVEDLILYGDYDRLLQAVDEREIDIDHPLGGQEETLLHMAVKYNADELVEGLLMRGAQVDSITLYGTTPLHMAATHQNLNIAEMLLRSGAEIDAQEAEGRTALMRAVEQSDDSMVGFLLEAGCNHLETDHHFSSAQDYAFARGDASMASRLGINQMPPRLDFKGPITKDDVLQRDENGLCALDANLTWYRWPLVENQLLANDATLSKADLLQTGRDGVSYLERGVSCGAFGSLLTNMHADGDQLMRADLLTENGEPNRLLKQIINAQQVPMIFNVENWLGQREADLRDVFRALPENVQDDIKNFQALLIKVSRDEAQQLRHAGGVQR